MNSRPQKFLKWEKFDAVKSTKSRRLSRSSIPPLPGVYQIIRRNTSKKKKNIFYVGETKNLQGRISGIFSCLKENTCCKCYKKAYKKFPTKKQMRETFVAKYATTKGMVGRIEIEEKLQSTHGTNKAEYYKKWKP